MPFEMNTRGLIALLLQFVLPLVVGLLTKVSWPTRTKAILLLALTAVTQFVVQFQDYLSGPDGSRFDWQSIAYAILIGFVVSVATHFGLWKPTGATVVAQMSLVNDGHSGDYPASSRR